MVEAEQQVLDAEDQVAEHLPALAGLDDEVRILRSQQPRDRRAVREGDVDQDVGERARQALDAHAMSDETLLAAVRAPLVYQGGALHVRDLLQFQRAVVGQVGFEGQPSVAHERLFPEDVENVALGFGDAEVGGPHFVAVCGHRKQDADQGGRFPIHA